MVNALDLRDQLASVERHLTEIKLRLKQSPERLIIVTADVAKTLEHVRAHCVAQRRAGVDPHLIGCENKDLQHYFAVSRYRGGRHTCDKKLQRAKDAGVIKRVAQGRYIPVDWE